MDEGTRACEKCGGVFTGRRKHARYCSKRCQQGAWEDRVLRPTPGRACVVCSVNIDHMQGSAKCCSGKCATALRVLAAGGIPAGSPIPCAWCGSEFPKNYGTVFCSETCRKAKRRSDDGARSGEVAQCEGCDSPFRMKRKDQRYCTGRCRSLAHYTKHPDRYKSVSTRRKAAIRGATATERFARCDIFERDGWICYLCREAVSPDLAWPDPMSASLDHILPISRGGQHTRANVALAHLRCNLVKHDSLPEATCLELPSTADAPAA